MVIGEPIIIRHPLTVNGDHQVDRPSCSDAASAASSRREAAGAGLGACACATAGAGASGPRTLENSERHGTSPQVRLMPSRRTPVHGLSSLHSSCTASGVLDVPSIRRKVTSLICTSDGCRRRRAASSIMFLP